ncbi:MAG: hypothetical protein CMG60_04505 [Candidatus Marinimicrobia bacterium]|nr:hypothetical protein [Candidatus Neomarinimicrobiota bacterium]
MIQNKKSIWVPCMLLLSIIAIIVQYFISGLRWQILPATYLLVMVFICYKYQLTNRFIGFMLSIWLTISIILPWAVPIFSLPSPEGKFMVGTDTFHWVDSSRLEWFTKDSGDLRELMVQVWYPTDSVENFAKCYYMDHLELRSKTLATAGKIPAFLTGHLDMIKTNSYKKARLPKNSNVYPVFIFSHGISGSRHLHQSLFEYLASQGYVVFAPDHSFDANLTIFPDGRVADYRSEITGDPDSIAIRKKQLETRSLDISHVIDRIEMLNQESKSFLGGRLDLKKIGVGGHSFGGGTATLASYRDKRIKACIVLDSWMSPLSDSVISGGVKVPFFHMGRPTWNDSGYPKNYDVLERLLSHSQKESNHIRIKNTLHLDYSDIPLMSPLIGKFMDVGNLRAKDIVTLVNKMTYGFLEKHIMGSNGRILDQSLDSKLVILK